MRSLTTNRAPDRLAPIKVDSDEFVVMPNHVNEIVILRARKHIT